MTQEEFHKRYQYNPATDCLGEGGFGKVYKAYDTHRDRWVAIKMAEVKPHLEEVRLKKEVEMISKLPSHPNIAYYEECHTFSSFTGEYDFGILQYYDQGNLEQLLSTKQLTESQKESILRQILEGIAFLHSQGIIHRDLKPQNILIVNRNGEYIPKITDFGISKKLDASKSSVFTNSLAGAGTLVYASPEQLCGQTIKKNTDLWSFGVMACRVLQGKLPFETGNQAITSEAGRIELYKQITRGEIAPFVNQLPQNWYNLVQKCLVVNVDERVLNIESCLNILDGNISYSKENVKKPEVDNLFAPKIITENSGETSKATSEINKHTYDNNHVNNRFDNVRLEIIEKETVSLKKRYTLFGGIAVVIVIIVLIFFSNNSGISNAPIAEVADQNSPISSGAIQQTDLENVEKASPKNSKDIVWLDEKVGYFTDPRDKQKYDIVKIGGQIWFAENFRFKTPKSKPYPNANIANYGRIYPVTEARKFTPEGWRLPTQNDISTLIEFVGGDQKASVELTEKGHSGFNALLGLGTESAIFYSTGITTGDYQQDSNIKVAPIADFWSDEIAYKTDWGTVRYHLVLNPLKQSLQWTGEAGVSRLSVRYIKIEQ